MSDTDSRTQAEKIRDRAQDALTQRLQQGFTEQQIAQAGHFTDIDDLQTNISRILQGISSYDLQRIINALWVDDMWLLTGEAVVVYSPCSQARLLASHYTPQEGLDHA